MDKKPNEYTYINIKDIKDLELKISNFLNSMDEEIRYISGIKDVNGFKSFIFPIIGFACLNDGKIIGLRYQELPRPYTLKYLKELFFPTKIIPTHIIVKKEHQRKGIWTKLSILGNNFLYEIGYRENLIIIDNEHEIRLKIARNQQGLRYIKKTKYATYYAQKIEYKELEQ